MTNHHDDEPRERIDIGSALTGLKIHPLPDEVSEVEFAYVIAKVKYKDGCVSWLYRTSVTPDKYELLGALRIHEKLLESELLEDWEPEEEEEAEETPE